MTPEWHKTLRTAVIAISCAAAISASMLASSRVGMVRARAEADVAVAEAGTRKAMFEAQAEQTRTTRAIADAIAKTSDPSK